MVIQRIEPFGGYWKWGGPIGIARQGFIGQGQGQGQGQGEGERPLPIPIDLTHDDDAVSVRASIPGAAPEDIDVAVEDGALTISAETQNDGDGAFIIRERRAGKLRRTIRLPNSLDVDKAETEYKHGVLTVVFPKAAAARTRRLEIKGG